MEPLRFHILLFCFWLAYVILHSLLAAAWFKLWVAKKLGENYRYYRISYSLFAGISLLLLVIFQFSEPGVWIYQPGVFTYLLSIPLALIGLIVMSVCIHKYFLNLSGVDVFMKTKHEAVLERQGLHSYVRHPLYSGTLLFVWAVFLSFPLVANLIACTVMTVYTLVGIRMEEKKLLLEFGTAYKSYAESIPMLIPFMKKKPGQKKIT